MFNGQKLKEYRESKGLTKIALAASVGRTEYYVRALEAGTRCEALNVIKLMCDKLEISINDLFDSQT